MTPFTPHPDGDRPAVLRRQAELRRLTRSTRRARWRPHLDRREDHR